MRNSSNGFQTNDRKDIQSQKSARIFSPGSKNQNSRQQKGILSPLQRDKSGIQTNFKKDLTQNQSLILTSPKSSTLKSDSMTGSSIATNRERKYSREFSFIGSGISVSQAKQLFKERSQSRDNSIEPMAVKTIAQTQNVNAGQQEAMQSFSTLRDHFAQQNFTENVCSPREIQSLNKSELEQHDLITQSFSSSSKDGPRVCGQVPSRKPIQKGSKLTKIFSDEHLHHSQKNRSNLVSEFNREEQVRHTVSSALQDIQGAQGEVKQKKAIKQSYSQLGSPKAAFMKGKYSEMKQKATPSSKLKSTDKLSGVKGPRPNLNQTAQELRKQAQTHRESKKSTYSRQVAKKPKQEMEDSHFSQFIGSHQYVNLETPSTRGNQPELIVNNFLDAASGFSNFTEEEEEKFTQGSQILSVYGNQIGNSLIEDSLQEFHNEMNRVLDSSSNPHIKNNQLKQAQNVDSFMSKESLFSIQEQYEQFQQMQKSYEEQILFIKQMHAQEISHLNLKYEENIIFMKSEMKVTYDSTIQDLKLELWKMKQIQNQVQIVNSKCELNQLGEDIDSKLFPQSRGSMATSQVDDLTKGLSFIEDEIDKLDEGGLMTPYSTNKIERKLEMGEIEELVGIERERVCQLNEEIEILKKQNESQVEEMKGMRVTIMKLREQLVESGGLIERRDRKVEQLYRELDKAGELESEKLKKIQEASGQVALKLERRVREILANVDETIKLDPVIH